MKEDLIKKYVRDLNGLLNEVELMDDVGAYRWSGKKEEMVIFIFGRLFRFFKFDSLLMGHEPSEGGLDGTAWTQEDGKVEETKIEFEVFSKNFERHGHDKSQRCVVVCWEDDWENPPDNLEVIELKQFWEKT